MAKVYPFHTLNEEDHTNSPVYHDDDTCKYGKKILTADKVNGKGTNRNLCKECEKNG